MSSTTEVLVRDDRHGGGSARNRAPKTQGPGPKPAAVTKPETLVAITGIVDILDNNRAFVRTSGYLPGPDDVFVSPAQVRTYGLRKGDLLTGAARPGEDPGEESGQKSAQKSRQKSGQKSPQKARPLVRVDTVTGLTPAATRDRPDFAKLTPLYPQERLRLETVAADLTTRVIDLVSPIGKGQRGLIVSPPKAGKTIVLQALANAITRNNPECHLMVVLIDERPEEVTDMQRSVNGEVISSTFDRSPEYHTAVAELAIERAKRMVELGHDVVVLLDSITRLGRAYNNTAAGNGRLLTGGLDSRAQAPPKRFLGAARNIEDGGSLTILATALVETGSRMDDHLFEEFKSTGNMELRLNRSLADRRIFPAVDLTASGTRREEILLSPEELHAVSKLRRALHSLEPSQALDLLLNRIADTESNAELLLQVHTTAPGPNAR
jgi:transcription termination factor Rho